MPKVHQLPSHGVEHARPKREAQHSGRLAHGIEFQNSNYPLGSPGFSKSHGLARFWLCMFGIPGRERERRYEREKESGREKGRWREVGAWNRRSILVRGHCHLIKPVKNTM